MNYFIPCYDVRQNEIYFTNFFTEEMIIKPEETVEEPKPLSPQITMKKEDSPKPKELTEEEKKIKLRKETEEKYLLKFSLNWNKMQVLSGFNKMHYISKNFEEYFKRPLYSRFFMPQNLQLYSYNSCVPLPNVIASYLTIPVTIQFHLDSLLGRTFDKDFLNGKIENEGSNDIYNLSNSNVDQNMFGNNILDKYNPELKVKKDIEANSKIRQISFFYVVDTLIKDCVREFEDLLKTLLKNSYNDEEVENVIKGYLDKFQEYKKDKSYKFILKVAESEEYLYGDYTLGSYDFLRGRVRQHEGITVILKRIPFYKVQPPLFNFPPIIRMRKSDANYYNLLDQYFLLYPEQQIIYRLYKPDKPQLARFLKNKAPRTSQLTRFTESGDCDIHLNFKIMQLENIYQCKKWFDNSIYNKNELVLPYVNPLKKLQIKKKGVFSQLCTSLCQCFIPKKKDTADKDNQQQEDELEKEAIDKLISKHENKKKENKEIENILNNLKIESSYDSFEYSKSNLMKTAITFMKGGSNTNYFHEVVANLSNKKRAEEYNINNTNNNPFDKSTYHLSRGKIINNKFEQFVLLNHPPTLPYPVYIRVKICLLYGCYCLRKVITEPFLLSDSIIINERIIFDSRHCLISHLPFETRIAISVKAYDQKLDESFVLGSCQIPLYKDNGEMQTGKVRYELWPNVKIFPRVNTSTPFTTKFPNFKNKTRQDLCLPERDKNPTVVDNLIKYQDKISPDFAEMLELINKEKELKLWFEYKEKKSKNKPVEGESKNSNEMNEDDVNQPELSNNTVDSIPPHEKNNYPSIVLEFPKFASPLIHTIKNADSYRQFLQVKYKKNRNGYFEGENDFDEIRKLFGNSQIELKKIMKSLHSSNDGRSTDYTLLLKKDELSSKKNQVDKYPTDIWDYLHKNLPLIIKILKKDPLEKMEEKETIAILICRDYISTIPSALELFLRAIDWRNPFEVSIAHLYLKRWTPIDGEDAVSLLDARFPDTAVREYAVSRLRELPDEMISAYMLILCQCLLYETFLVNPLADFLIEKSLMNPKLLGNSFLWNSRINKKNPLFYEKLSAYLLQLLMVAGDHFLQTSFDGVCFNYYLELMTYCAKNEFKICPGDKKKAAIEHVRSICKYFNESIYKSKKFSFPIDPTFLGIRFTDNVLVFKSKMVPVLLEFYTREPPLKKKVIFKIGDDLRQDVLTIQMLKIMDKLWLDNNLDLKLLSYKVHPTEVNAGFIECVTAKELAQIQNKSGVSGALDRELIIKYLRGTNSESATGDQQANKTDNFIKSLAGYCVATCVLGVADRHSSNVMIQSNGLFLHIDFGHILGNFKFKFGVKRERSVFLLTPEMANVYINDKKEEQFKKMCAKAFNILRHNAPKLMNSFIIMSTSGMPEFFGICDIKYMKQMLVLDKPNDEDAGNYFIEQIRKCKNEKFRQIDNIIHNIKQ